MLLLFLFLFLEVESHPIYLLSSQALKKEIEKISKEGKGGNLKTLQKQLTEKEHQISRLRNQKKELQNLTRVEARNEKHVMRLKAEVDSMKREKVNLTKRIEEER